FTSKAFSACFASQRVNTTLLTCSGSCTLRIIYDHQYATIMKKIT
ncbi:unnamed protein product, partial [Amoebophrya sp. A25]